MIDHLQNQILWYLNKSSINTEETFHFEQFVLIPAEKDFVEKSGDFVCYISLHSIQLF